MSITRDEVARLAGVSPITVSRVFRGSRLVAEETRKKVLGIARQTRYAPHAGARAMRCGRFGRIAFAVIQYGRPGEPYTPTHGYLDVVTHLLAERNYSVVVEPLYLNSRGEYLRPPRLFSEMAMDGVIGLPAGGYVPAEVDEHLRQMNAPVVWLNRNAEAGLECFNGDEFLSGRLLAEHLIGLGHERIAYIGFESGHYSALQRSEGVRAALLQAGLATEHFVIKPSRGVLCLNDVAERFFREHSAATAVICYSRRVFDVIVHHATRRGVRIPRDLSACYFASLWETLWMDYQTTVLEIPERQMAMGAVQTLLARVEKNREEIPYSPPAGRVLPGWTTARPGEEWPGNVSRCEHEREFCVVELRRRQREEDETIYEEQSERQGSDGQNSRDIPEGGGETQPKASERNERRKQE